MPPWLARQPLAANAHRAYRGHVRRFCVYVHTHIEEELNRTKLRSLRRREE